MSSSLALVAIIGCVLVTSLMISATGGAIAGQRERNLYATQTTVGDFDVQYQLALEDIQGERYDLARQRLQWIADRDPTYPGVLQAIESISDVSSLSSTSEPTLAPSDSDDPEELYTEAKAFFDNNQYENAINRLETLQVIAPTYRTVDVKGMLYEARKALGLAYIRSERIEEGIVLLEDAAAISPLDDAAAGELNLAKLYINGKAYWELNWFVVIQNFEIIYSTAPNYKDVASRLWEARVSLAEAYMVQGSACEAAAQLELALLILDDPDVQDQYTTADEQCDSTGGVSPAATATQLGGTTGGTSDGSTGGSTGGGPGSSTATPVSGSGSGSTGGTSPTPIPGPGTR